MLVLLREKRDYTPKELQELAWIYAIQSSRVPRYWTMTVPDQGVKGKGKLTGKHWRGGQRFRTVHLTPWGGGPRRWDEYTAGWLSQA